MPRSALDLHDNLSVALDLASRGFCVFPQRDWGDGDGRKPIAEFPDKATVDHAAIRNWWAKWPDALPCLLTGARNGVTVLDVDVKNGKDGVAALAELGFLSIEEMTPVRARTPSGGWHLFFAHNPGVKGTVGKIGPGLDVRNVNQFVVAPGCIKDGRRYQVDGCKLGSIDLPPWPEALTPAPEPERDPVIVLDVASREQIDWAESQLEKRAAAVAATQEGGRQAALNDAAFWAGGAAAHGMLVEDDARDKLVPAGIAAGLTRREAEGTFEKSWQAGLRKPISDFPGNIDYGAEFDDLDARSPTDLSQLLGDGIAPPVPLTLVNANSAIMRTKKGEVQATQHNAVIFMTEADRRHKFGIRRNEFSGRDEWRAGVIGDEDVSALRVAIEQAGMRNVTDTLTHNALRMYAKQNSYHPLQDWLNGLQDSGAALLDTWLIRYAGAADTPLNRMIGRKFLIAMVARAMSPGCKHDHVLVLMGAQGLGKSRLCRTLAGEDWFGDDLPLIRDDTKEAAGYLPGHWLIELAELAPSRKADANALKAFITRQSDEIRRPSGRRTDILPRQSVFIGTTNEDTFLRDNTGGRRWWPVECTAIDLDGLERDRSQLFSEAVAAYRSGEQWHLPEDMRPAAQALQEGVREVDPWEAVIGSHLSGDGEFNEATNKARVSELLWQPLGIPVAQQTRAQQLRVVGCLRAMGWVQGRSKGDRFWTRVSGDTGDAEVTV